MSIECPFSFSWENISCVCLVTHEIVKLIHTKVCGKPKFNFLIDLLAFLINQNDIIYVKNTHFGHQ